MDVIGCGNGEKGDISEILPTRKDLSCPNVRFSDNGGHRTGYEDRIEDHPVLEQKTIFSEQPEDGNSINNLSTCELMRTDLKNYARSHYNLIVE